MKNSKCAKFPGVHRLRSARISMLILSPKPTQTAGRFRCETKGTEMFRKRRENFACEKILFRQAPRKLLKSLGREISNFAVSCDFKGLRPILFRAPFSPSVFRSARRVQLQFMFSEFIDSTNSIPGKAKGDSLRSEICPVPRNRLSKSARRF